ncbi:MAG: DUF2924 domain-containing protein [Alphaproteobacteria bacterium]|nr:DUF2924 domain-containing protein [Alphaproteobacteria bacterium]
MVHMRQIKDLQDKSFAELKQLWRDYYQAEPPPYRRGFMARALAYRIQELTYGGLSEKASNRLEDMLAEAEGTKPKKRAGKVRLPVAGSRLVREWRGERHEIIILSDGFEFAGRKWGSLTAIARQITGTHWNGPAFFGLRAKREGTACENAEAA